MDTVPVYQGPKGKPLRVPPPIGIHATLSLHQYGKDGGHQQHGLLPHNGTADNDFMVGGTPVVWLSATPTTRAADAEWNEWKSILIEGRQHARHQALTLV
jgi:hypothetical protein